jgi:hypothetical protein
MANPIITQSLHVIRSWCPAEVERASVARFPATAAVALAEAIRESGGTAAVEPFLGGPRPAERLYRDRAAISDWLVTPIPIRAAVLKKIRAGSVSGAELRERYVNLNLEPEYGVYPKKRSVTAWLEENFAAEKMHSEAGGTVWRMADEGELRVVVTCSTTSGMSLMVGTKDNVQGVRDVFSLPHLTGSTGVALLDLCSEATWESDKDVFAETIKKTVSFLSEPHEPTNAR